MFSIVVHMVVPSGLCKVVFDCFWGVVLVHIPLSDGCLGLG